MNPTLFAATVRTLARPFTQYVLTVAMAVYMFVAKPDIQILLVVAGLLGYHGYLRTQDKKAGVGDDAAPSAPSSPQA